MIDPSENGALTKTLAKRLWDSADQLRASSGLMAREYSGPILGIAFLRCAAQPRSAVRAFLVRSTVLVGGRWSFRGVKFQ